MESSAREGLSVQSRLRRRSVRGISQALGAHLEASWRHLESSGSGLDGLLQPLGVVWACCGLRGYVPAHHMKLCHKRIIAIYILLEHVEKSSMWASQNSRRLLQGFGPLRAF